MKDTWTCSTQEWIQPLSLPTKLFSFPVYTFRRRTHLDFIWESQWGRKIMSQYKSERRTKCKTNPTVHLIEPICSLGFHCWISREMILFTTNTADYRYCWKSMPAIPLAIFFLSVVYIHILHMLRDPEKKRKKKKKIERKRLRSIQ